MSSFFSKTSASFRFLITSVFLGTLTLASLGVSPVQAASVSSAKVAKAGLNTVTVRPAHVAPYSAAVESTKRVVFMWDGSWLVLHGLNGYTASKGIPTEVTDILDKANNNSKEIKDVAFTADGEWVVITGRNALNASANFPQKAYDKLSSLNDKSEDIKFISFTDDGSWVAVWGDNGWSSLGIPDDLDKALTKVNSDSNVIKDVAFVTTASTDAANPSSAWVMMNDGANPVIWSAGVPQKMVDILKKRFTSGDKINSAAFSSDGNWVILANATDATYTLNLPAALIKELKTLAGDTSA